VAMLHDELKRQTRAPRAEIQLEAEKLAKTALS
jgi:hypothetical protein